jgi:hypothetical protein
MPDEQTEQSATTVTVEQAVNIHAINSSESLGALSTLKHDAYKLLNNAHIFITDGIHEGATFNITAPTTIGSGFDNDVILSDDAIETSHLSLEPVYTKLGFGIKITCLGEQIICNGTDIISKNQSIFMSEPCIITMGDISLKLHINVAGTFKTLYGKYLAPQMDSVNDFTHKTAETLAPAKILSDTRNIILLVMGFLLIGIVGYNIVMLNMQTDKSAYFNGQNHYKELRLKENNDNKKAQQQALNDLNETLENYDLSGRVTAYQDDASLYVTGKINSYENVQWAKVQNWYDSTYAPVITLVSLIQVDNGARRAISFKAVVTKGKMPFVVSWTGARYKVGATLPGGWIIMDINEKGVVVKDAVDNRTFLVEHIHSA